MNRTPFVLSSALFLLAGSAFAGDTLKVPGQFFSIQAAVDAAKPGDVISISEGTFAERVVISTSDITLNGRDTILDGAYGGTCLQVHANGVTLIGLDFVNGGTLATTDTPAQGGGLDYVGDGASIQRCAASGSTNFGISLTGHGEIKNCEVIGCLGAGIVVDTNDQHGAQVEVSSNEVSGNGAGIVAEDGPFFFNRNSVKFNTGNGISLSILGASDSNVAMTTEFRNVLCVGNGGTGLLIHDETGSTRKIEIGQLSGNAKGLDVMAKGVTLRNLDVDNNHSGGVFFKVTNGSIEFSNVRHNGLVGILVQKSDGEIDGGSTVTDNRVDANGGDGIHIESNLNLVRHNVVKTSKGDGIQLATGATSNTLLKNAVRDSRHDGIDNWGTNTMMTDNVAQNSVGADIADIGDGNGTVAVGSSGNVTTDASNLSTKQELELDTLAAP